MDFSRLPTPTEAQSLRERLARLQQQQRAGEFERLAKHTLPLSTDRGLVLRRGFAFRPGDSNPDASDRRAPARELRPPATRLISSRGASLRFELTLIAWVQASRKAGSKARIKDSGKEIVGSTDRPAWSDLLAADAQDTRSGKRDVYITGRDKRGRSVRSALTALSRAGLVEIPTTGGRRDLEGFVLLDERGFDTLGERLEYRVPDTRTNAVFKLPAEFISQGWVHVLEDSEIALLLMIACSHGGFLDGGMLAMPSAVRLHNYGLHRDPYRRARKSLQWLALIDTDEPGRHPDGRAEESEFLLNRFRLLHDAFARPASAALIATIQQQLARVS